jgi:uncharacterized cupredoxin-like copper-binding protein
MASASHSAGARVVTAAVVALLLGACAGTTNTTTTPSAASSPSASAAPVGTSVGVVEKEFSITLDKTSFTAGNYTFSIKNEGKFPHNLAIEGPGVDKKVSDTMQGGGSGTLAVALQAGTYELSCGIPGHKDKGMDLKITVG